MSTTPEPASSTAATGPDEAEAVEATKTAEAVEPETTEKTDATEVEDPEAEGVEADTASDADDSEAAPPTAPTPSSSTSPDKDTDRDSDSTSDDGPDEKSDETSEDDRQKSAEEFAAEHDPANHDVAAGEEFRQPGDWTADEAGGPQVFDDEGNLVSEGGEPTGASDKTDSGDGAGAPAGSSSGGGRRVSELDEVRDGGYSVGSAATLHDGAMPLGHPVKAWEDTKTFVTEEHDHYDEAEPDVWFTDADAAQRAGFRPAD